MLAVFGESAHYIESVKSLNSSIANAMRTFPKKYKHLNIVYVCFKAEFEIGKGLFENLENSKSDLPNFWKFENWKSFQMNEPNGCKCMCLIERWVSKRRSKSSVPLGKRAFCEEHSKCVSELTFKVNIHYLL